MCCVFSLVIKGKKRNMVLLIFMVKADIYEPISFTSRFVLFYGKLWKKEQSQCMRINICTVNPCQ